MIFNYARKPAKIPATNTEVIVTVVKPPTIMDGNILLIRYWNSSSVLPKALQVDSVMIASGGKPYSAVRPFASARGKDIFRILEMMNAAIAIPATPITIRMTIGPII